MMKIRAMLILAAVAVLSSCSYFKLSFSKPLSPDEIALEQEVREFYTEMGQAFATGSVDTLAGLFSPSITHPMTQAKVRDWAADFFKRNGNAHLKILSFDFDELAYQRAVVTLKYRIETPSGTGDFGATETDTLARRGGHWYIESWDKTQ